MAWLNRLSGFLQGNQATLVITGLPHSGKTTLLKQLQPALSSLSMLQPSIPMDFCAEKFTYKSLTVVNFDLGDISCFGNPWEDFYRGCHALIYVVDGTDRYSMEPAKIEQHKMLCNPLVEKDNVPVLILVNKSDQQGSLPHLQVSEMLDVRRIKDKSWNIFSTDGLTGEGLWDALDWLAHQLKSRVPSQQHELRRQRNTVRLCVSTEELWNL